MDRQREKDAWAHLKWANLLGAAGIHELRVPVSRKMQYQLKPGEWFYHQSKVEWLYHHSAATVTISLGEQQWRTKAFQLGQHTDPMKASDWQWHDHMLLLQHLVRCQQLMAGQVHVENHHSGIRWLWKDPQCCPREQSQSFQQVEQAVILLKNCSKWCFEIPSNLCCCIIMWFKRDKIKHEPLMSDLI